VIIDPRGGNIRVPEPLLHLGDVGMVIERIGGSRCAQRMRADLGAEIGFVLVERPRLHKVILVNDDYTPREFVVTVLKAVLTLKMI
jgi:hypothetical protein